MGEDVKDAVQSGGLIDYIFPIFPVSHPIMFYIPGEGKGEGKFRERDICTGITFKR